MSSELLRLLPSQDEFPVESVPEDLRQSFMDSVAVRLSKQKSAPQDTPFDWRNTKHLDAFFSLIGDGKAPVVTSVAKKGRRSLDSNSTSKRASFSMCVEEFQMSLLQDTTDQINVLSKEVLEQITNIRSIEAETKSFQRMIDELDESVKNWREKTQILMEKSRVQPNYEAVDNLLSRDTKQNLEAVELLLRNLKAKKSMETVLAETVPHPDSTAESMAGIRRLVEEFINDDKSGL